MLFSWKVIEKFTFFFLHSIPAVHLFEKSMLEVMAIFLICFAVFSAPCLGFCLALIIQGQADYLANRLNHQIHTKIARKVQILPGKNQREISLEMGF